MVAVNEAFRFAHDLLCNGEIHAVAAEAQKPPTAGGSEVIDCAAYRYKYGELLFLDRAGRLER